MIITLPTAKTPPKTTWPKNLLIYSKPKVGKTTLCADLPNCLIFELEQGGADYVESMHVEIPNLETLVQYGQLILQNGKPYEFIAIDTITKLEELCLPLAEKLYSESPGGKNWFTDPEKGKSKYKTITNLPNGGGYAWLRLAFDQIKNFILTLAPNVIFLGHVKDVLLEKNGVDVSAMDLDLTGRLKRIMVSESDAIGYLYRKGNQNILSFQTSDEVSCGARPEHLRNQKIVISELDPTTGKIQINWDTIYPKINKTDKK
jgi:hypothetical protein